LRRFLKKKQQKNKKKLTNVHDKYNKKITTKERPDESIRSHTCTIYTLSEAIADIAARNKH